MTKPFTSVEPPWFRDVTCFGVTSPIETKPSNPKDIAGSNKVGLSVVPCNVMMELALALTEGMFKYGKHNFRGVGVRASIYYDAFMRHIMAWWEGQDIDPDSGISHITKAIACLTVLRDSMMQGNWTDDRPPKCKDEDWLKGMNVKFCAIKAEYKHIQPKHYFQIDGAK